MSSYLHLLAPHFKLNSFGAIVCAGAEPKVAAPELADVVVDSPVALAVKLAAKGEICTAGENK